MGLFDNKKEPDFSDVVKGTATGNAGGQADFSDVQAGSSTTAASANQTYTVKKGDSLSKIAKHFYGDGNAWKKIHTANQDKIPNPDLIYPGQELTIPGA